MNDMDNQNQFNTENQFQESPNEVMNQKPKISNLGLLLFVLSLTLSLIAVVFSLGASPNPPQQDILFPIITQQAIYLKTQEAVNQQNDLDLATHIALINQNSTAIAVQNDKLNALQTTLSFLNALNLSLTPSLTVITPTIEPIVFTKTPVGPNVIFYDSFDDNSKGWNYDSSTIIENGQLIVNANSQQLLLVPQTIPARFYAEVKVRIAGETKDRAKLVFNFGDITNLQTYTYVVVNNNYIEVYEVNSGRVQRVSSTSNVIDVFENEVLIGITYRDENAAIYIDGNFIMVTPTINIGNEIALGGNFSSVDEEYTLIFDSIKVYSIDE